MTRATVLVVDDDPEARDVYCTFLRSRGFDVADAPDGEAAIQHVSSSAPDVILLDFVLPGESGMQILRRLRSDPRMARVRVVLMSGFTEGRLREHAYQAGADLVLAKPFLPEQVEAVIRSFVPRA